MMLSADEADATDPEISYNQKSPGETPRLFVENDGRGEELPLGRLGFDVDIGRPKQATCSGFNLRIKMVTLSRFGRGFVGSLTRKGVAANAVAFLASELACYITGVYLPVSGGAVMPTI